jgi:hypothetical protein
MPVLSVASTTMVAVESSTVWLVLVMVGACQSATSEA